MSTPAPSTQHLLRVRTISRELEHFELRATRSRISLYQAIAEAAAAGIPIKSLVRACGLTRQRIHQILIGQKKLAKP